MLHDASELPNQLSQTQSDMWNEFRASGKADELALEQREKAVLMTFDRWKMIRDELGEGSAEEILARNAVASMILTTGVSLPLQSSDEKQ